MKPEARTRHSSPAESANTNADLVYSGTTDIYDINATGSVTDKVRPVTQA